MLPTLGEERQQTYSPFLPVSPRSGKVLLAKVVDRDLAKGTITYVEEDGSTETVPVTGGHCKLQWKPDMGMRWAALGVDYEMYGKDHLTSAKLYDAICRIAGGMPPDQYMFELFLDDKGQKISKSKGNGITIEQWLSYGPAESLALFMFQKPRAAKRLHFDVIPKAVDDYIALLESYHASETSEARAAGKSCLAYSWRQGARRTLSGQLRAAAQPGVGIERAQSRRAVGQSSALMRRRRRRRPIPAWIIWSVSRCAITRIS